MNLFDVTLPLSAASTLFVVLVVDPPGRIPVFQGPVGRRPAAARDRAARQAVLVSLAATAGGPTASSVRGSAVGG